jgi:hypothetical protein
MVKTRDSAFREYRQQILSIAEVKDRLMTPLKGQEAMS